MLSQPLLYLSLFLKQHRERYYELLQTVRETGDWEAWLRFFLTGVQETAGQAVTTATRLLALFEADRQRLRCEGGSAASIFKLHDHLQRSPATSTTRAAQAIGASLPTATTGLRRLESLGLVREMTGGKYRRVYAYNEYLAILSEGTEPLR